MWNLCKCNFWLIIEVRRRSLEHVKYPHEFHQPTSAVADVQFPQQYLRFVNYTSDRYSLTERLLVKEEPVISTACCVAVTWVCFCYLSVPLFKKIPQTFESFIKFNTLKTDEL